MMWSEANLRLFHDLSPSLPLYLNATGNPVRKIFTDAGKMLYYALVVAHPKEKKTPIAVAGMFSSNLSVNTLPMYFLLPFKHAAANLYGGKVVTRRHNVFFTMQDLKYINYNILFILIHYLQQ